MQKLSENIGKPKELWKSLKTLINSPLTNIWLKTKDNFINFDDKKKKKKFKKKKKKKKRSTS